MTPQQIRTRRRRRAGAFWAAAGLLVLGVGIGVALSGQPVATAGSSGGTVSTAAQGGQGRGAGSSNPAKSLVVTGTATNDLAPGRDATLTVTVSNPNNQDVVLTSVSAAVTGVQPTTCRREWITIPAAGQGVVVRRGGTATVELRVVLDNLTAVNQDACQGATYDFRYTADGRQA